MATITSTKIKSLSENIQLSFTSSENPFVFATPMDSEGNIGVTVIAPYHSNVKPKNLVVSVSVDTDSKTNIVRIKDSSNPGLAPENAVYTQVVKISFTINGVCVDKYDKNDIKENIVVIANQYCTLPNPNTKSDMFGAPDRKTEIIAQNPT